MIALQNISKNYGNVQALKALSLHIKKGEFYSLLGPNGAGKTTTINLLGGLFLPDTGDIFIDGKNLRTEGSQLRTKIGVVPQEIALYNDLTALENLRFWARVNQLSKSNLEDKIKEVLQFLGLADRAHQAVGKYSGGMKRRINIAAALLHNPDILFFDEPTVGIDPQSRSFIYAIFEQLRAQGKTILYTSHYLEEVERLSDRIGIIDEGKLVVEGRFEDLKQSSGLRETINICYKPLTNQQLKQLEETALMQSSKALYGSLDAEKCVFVGTHRSDDLRKLVQLFAEHKIDIQQIEIKPVDLEKVYMCFTKTALRD